MPKAETEEQTIGRITRTGETSLGLTIPRDVIEVVGWEFGTRVKITYQPGRIILEELKL